MIHEPSPSEALDALCNKTKSTKKKKKKKDFEPVNIFVLNSSV